MEKKLFKERNKEILYKENPFFLIKKKLTYIMLKKKANSLFYYSEQCMCRKIDYITLPNVNHNVRQLMNQ